MNLWYYMKNGSENGPVATAEIRRLLADGGLTPQTLVWREGAVGWAPIQTVAEFTGTTLGSPPWRPPRRQS